MTKREKITRSCIRHGDFYYNRVLQDILKFSERRPFLDDEERIVDANIIASNIALVCEYYLKGIIMQESVINLSDDMKQTLISETGTDKLSEDEEIALIKDDKIINKLLDEFPQDYKGLIALRNKQVTINGTRKTLLKILQKSLQDSKSTFSSIGHDLNIALDKLLENSKERITNNLRSEPITYSMLFSEKKEDWTSCKEEPFSRFIEDNSILNSRECNYFLRILNNPVLYTRGLIKSEEYTEDNFYPLGDTEDYANSSTAYMVDPSKSEVKDAFPNGRYGAIHSNNNDLYKADIDALYKFMHAIQISIEKIVHNAIFINRKKFIFPDENSDICIYNSNKESIGKIHYNRFKLYIKRR